MFRSIPDLDVQASGSATAHGAAAHSPFGWIAIGLAVAALLIVMRVALVAIGLESGDQQGAPAAAVSVAVGPVALAIPSNMLRDHHSVAGGGSSGGVEDLDLRVHWPTMQGYSEERADAFSENDARSQIIYVTIRPAAGTIGPGERYDQVYRRLLTGFPEIGPGGLVAQAFSRGYGYDGEALFVSPKEDTPFVARCTPEEGDAPASCLVEFRTERGVDVAYRFRRPMLSRWKAIDNSVRDMITGFAANR